MPKCLWNLHREYQLSSCLCTNFQFLSHWHNHSDRVGTQGTNRQVKQVVQLAVNRKANKKVKTQENCCFAEKQDTVHKMFVCVHVCFSWLYGRVQRSRKLPAAPVQGQTQNTHAHTAIDTYTVVLKCL